MKTDLFKAREGRPMSSLFLKFFALLAMMLVGVNGVWAQDAKEISTFTMPTSTPGIAFDDGTKGGDGYYLGIDRGVTYYAIGLKDRRDGQDGATKNNNGYYYLPFEELEKSHFKLQFAPGTIIAGDVLSVTCKNYYSVSVSEPQEIGYRVGGSKILEKQTISTNDPVTIQHTITADEIITDGSNQYICVYKKDWVNTAYGKFTVTRPVFDHPAITCVNNTINLLKINTNGNCSFNAVTGQGSMNENGAYLSIKFENSINLSHLTSFVIDGTNVNKVSSNDTHTGVFNLAQFVCNGGNVDKYNNPAHADGFTDDQKSRLEAVTEIRLYSDNVTGEFSITSITLNFDDTHKKLKTPELIDGTSAYMEKGINEPFTLSVTNGYWREYKSDLSGEKPEGLISAYASTHKFNEGLTKGDYYFGIQDNTHTNCEFGVNHHSDLVTIHVRVDNFQPSLDCSKNTVDLSHVTTFGNITSELAGGKITGTISSNSDEYGNGFSIEFAEAQNFSHVSTITIKTNFDFSTDCDVYLEDAEKMNDEGTSKKAYWPWGNTYSNGTFTMHLDNDAQFAKIKKLVLRPHFNTGDFEISSITVEYDHSLTTPELVDGTESTITLTEGDILKLSANEEGNTYWREYKDANYNWLEQISTHIPTTEYNKPVREISGLAPGTYYFAAERGKNCEFGKWHTSDKATVVVVVKESSNDTDFAGYYRFNNRLAAQWNFDQCDGFRFNTAKIGSGNEYWTDGEDDGKGNKVYTYKKAIGIAKSGSVTDEDFYSNESNFAELTYDGNSNNKLAITAGLKFNAPANSIKLIVSYATIGGHQVAQGARLQVTPDVRMLVPYVENTFRNDMGSDVQPFETRNDAGDIIDDNRAEYANSTHHWKRDILYVSITEGNVWNVWRGDTHTWVQGHILNRCIDDNTKELFNSGGEENVNGIKWYKMNYMGNHGTPCVLQFQRETTFNRLAVNRNLTYSFYSEYISDFGATYEKPRPRVRVIGSPTGAQIANIGPFVTYNDAIAFTYGGWKSSAEDKDDDRYNYTSYEKESVSDQWGDLGVYTGNKNGFMTWSQMGTGSAPTSDNTVPVASDGFPVLSMNNVKATSGGLMPDNLTEDADVVTVNGKTLPNYHPINNGKLYVGESYPYKANITPWSLPSRGAYLKFEPSLPGVLNVHVFQQPEKIYYIADEFGIPQSATDVFTKTASNTNTIQKVTPAGVEDNTNGVGFFMTGTDPDYVKYSFNVYPGKTYYMFSNEAGMGFAGFYYEPYVERKSVSDEFGRWDVQVDEVSLDKATNYTFPTLPKASTNNGIETIQSPKKGGGYEDFDIHYSERAVKVSLNRSFKNGVWNSICLPYSMNQVQMEQVFGVGTRVILLRDLQNREHSDNNKVTLNFIAHENQDIIAGYPYFILPTKDVDNVTTIACLDKFPQHGGGIPSIVSVESKGPNTYSYADKDYNGLDEYTFKGTFNNVTVKKGSWYVGGDGMLKKLTVESATLNPYRAWLELKDGVNSSFAKEIGAIRGIDAEIEGDATDISIDELLENSGIFTKKANVYSVDGKMVRANAENLNGLPKGIYIVNGKKYIVK